MAIRTYQVSAVKDPFGDGFIGMAVGKHFDDTPLTLTTMDENGDMAVFGTEPEAQSAMNRILLGLAEFRFKPARDITPENLGRAARDVPEADEEI